MYTIELSTRRGYDNLTIVRVAIRGMHPAVPVLHYDIELPRSGGIRADGKINRRVINEYVEGITKSFFDSYCYQIRGRVRGMDRLYRATLPARLENMVMTDGSRYVQAGTNAPNR